MASNSKLAKFLAYDFKLLAPDIVEEMRAIDAGNVRAAADKWCTDARMPAVCWTLFLALARNKIPIEERWETLLPPGTKDTAAEFFECIDALDEARRVPAMQKAFAKRLPSQLIFAGLTFLSREASPEIAALVDDASKRSEVPKRSLVKKQLAALQARHAKARSTSAKAKAKAKAKATATKTTTKTTRARKASKARGTSTKKGATRR